MAVNIAKINTETNTIEEFPITDHTEHPELIRALRNPGSVEDLKAKIPEGYVWVEESEKPAMEWDQYYQITGAELVDGVWTTVTEVYNQYPTDEDKIQGAKVLKKAKTLSVKNSYNVQLQNLFASEYSEYEKSTFPEQRAEAKAYIADNTSSTPLLTAIATARGITVDALAAKVIEKAEAHDAAVGEILGVMKKNLDLLEQIDLNDPTTFSKFNELTV